ncbi:MAG: hypothetical protein HY727_09525 [Candidatus Rokubacteria bacterium]|nr:hypothetical protein [Candidatus Rokubacteria bacterium]
MTPAALPRVLSLALLLTVGVGPVAAEHEIYYRYIVLGYAKDARDRPLAGRAVEVVRDKTGFSYLTETDDQGFFLVVVRLGDESAGERLTLRIGGERTQIIARFHPANHADDRGTRVDLEATRFVERNGAFPTTLGEFLRAPGR